jgi:ApaG protein
MGNQIDVDVESFYVPERSEPKRSYYFFAYHITITNNGDAPAQLLTRHWVITDGTGKIQEVKGEGVVGEQPRLAPGQSFDYTSACPLPTTFGTMEGSYQMVTDGGETFDATIPQFMLAVPSALN